MVETSLANVEAELVAAIEETETRPSANLPFRVLLIGDWSGRANRRTQASSKELKTYRPLLVDRDNLDQLMATLGARLNIPLTRGGEQSLAINFNRLDDFHPDRLFNGLDVFDRLRRARAELESPATFSAAVARVRKGEPPQPPRAHPASPTTPAREAPVDHDPNQGNVLDRILAASQDNSSPEDVNQHATGTEAAAEVSRFAKAAADPYLTPNIERDQDEMIEAVDVLISALMNSVLHHEDFQALESAWRALDFLLSRLETGTDLKIYLLDVSRKEFAADLSTNGDVRSTALYKLLVEDTEGDIPWSVIGGNYTFDLSADDYRVIESISLISQAAGAPFIAGVTSDLLGCASLAATPDPDDWQAPSAKAAEESWETIRNLPSAAYLGLALPRFLVRLPYGRATEPTEEFEFEESGEDEDTALSHESYLWANPAFAIVYLLARGFSEGGPPFRPTDHLEIEGLPMHVYKRDDGDTEIKPCAEALLIMRAARKIIDRGLMPLLSIKDSDRIRLGMLQSIAGTALSGPWLRERTDD
jgi:type VI secretion system protein ImpC